MKIDGVNMDLMQNCIAYIRVSSDEQVTNFSLETQEYYCRKEAERRNLSILKTFREEGVSAKTLNRPALLALLAFCQKNKKNISYVVVYRLDRLSRNTIDYLALRKRFSEMGIEIISATGEPTGSSPTDKFFETILASLAELDNSLRGTRAKAGLRTRFLNGLPTGRPPLGYKNAIENEKHVIIPDPLS